LQPRFNGYSDPIGSVLAPVRHGCRMRHRVTREIAGTGGEDTLSSTVPNPGMASQNTALLIETAPSALTALAEQLRDGPLQRLVELQLKTTALADRLNDRPPGIEDLEQLARLSVAAMEHFNAFTREFASVLRELTDAERYPH
jgi:hypothetical protein